MRILKIPLTLHLEERDKLRDEIVLLDRLVKKLTKRWKVMDIQVEGERKEKENDSI